MSQYAQGDLLFVSREDYTLEDIDAYLKDNPNFLNSESLQKAGDIVIAKGELSGHEHVVEAEHALYSPYFREYDGRFSPSPHITSFGSVIALGGGTPTITPGGRKALYDLDGQKVLALRRPTKVRHISRLPMRSGEKLHGELELPAGVYTVIQQRRYDRKASIEAKSQRARTVLD